ncbi:hypothetical protein P3G55_24120 [Leptospira sp. 96542]|nr:hypothetical protein [Leptospira sp. 96542]
MLNDQKDLGKNSAMAAAGALADVARVGAAATAVVAEQSIGQAIKAWDKVGNGQKLAYDAELAGQVDALRGGDIQDAVTVQKIANKADQFLNGGDGDRVQVTEGTGVYGAAHKNNETIYLDMGTDGEGNRLLGSAVNTVAHEGGHKDGAGEISAAVTGFMTGLANSVNAWANSEQIAVAKQAFMKGLEAVPAVSEAENRALLNKNNSAFWEDAANNELDYRQLHLSEKELLKAKAADFAGKFKEAGYTPVTEAQALAILTEQAENKVDKTHAWRRDTATADDAVKAAAQQFLNQTAQEAGFYDDGRGNKIQYFTNFTAAGENRFEDYANRSINNNEVEVPGAKLHAFSPTSSSRETSARDVANASVNADPNYMPFFDYTKLQVGAFGKGVAISLNKHDGSVYMEGGASTSFEGFRPSLSPSPSFSLVVGRMLDGPNTPPERADAVNEMMGGYSWSASACGAAGFCAGVNRSVVPAGQTAYTAFELGVGTPGVGLGLSVSGQVGKLPRKLAP